eukprot:GHVU01045991.1.p2 GENE.GHVU01045991.1~~GHVU01045991.1.p2  ORF type:complete len:117 (+),score=2.81 GHVU01045991.1:882-1232(+)
MFQLGSTRLPTEGFLDSGSSQCWMGVGVLEELQDAGERIFVRALEAESPTARNCAGEVTNIRGIVDITVRVMSEGRTWLRVSNVPFFIVDEPFTLILLGQDVLHALGRRTNTRAIR